MTDCNQKKRPEVGFAKPRSKAIRSSPASLLNKCQWVWLTCIKCNCKCGEFSFLANYLVPPRTLSKLREWHPILPLLTNGLYVRLSPQRITLGTRFNLSATCRHCILATEATEVVRLYISKLSGSTFSAILHSWHACQNKSSCFSPNFVSCWCCPSRVHDGPGCPKQMKLNEIPIIQCLCICIGYRTKAKGLSLGQPGFSKGMLTMHNVRFKALTNVFLNSTAFFFGGAPPKSMSYSHGTRLKKRVSSPRPSGKSPQQGCRAVPSHVSSCQPTVPTWMFKWVGKEMSYPVLLDSLRNSPKRRKKAQKDCHLCPLSPSQPIFHPSFPCLSFSDLSSWIWVQFFWTQPILQRTLPPSATETLPPHPSTSLTNFHSFDQPINQRRENAGEKWEV